MAEIPEPSLCSTALEVGDENGIEILPEKLNDGEKSQVLFL